MPGEEIKSNAFSHDSHADKRGRREAHPGQDPPPPRQVLEDLKTRYAVGHADLHPSPLIG